MTEFNTRRMPAMEEPVPGGPCAIGRYIFPVQFDGATPCVLPTTMQFLVGDKGAESPYGFCRTHARDLEDYILEGIEIVNRDFNGD